MFLRKDSYFWQNGLIYINKKRQTAISGWQRRLHAEGKRDFFSAVVPFEGVSILEFLGTFSISMYRIFLIGQ